MRYIFDGILKSLTTTKVKLNKSSSIHRNSIGSQLRQEIKFLLQFHNVAKKRGTNKSIPFYWTHTEILHHVSVYVSVSS